MTHFIVKVSKITKRWRWYVTGDNGERVGYGGEPFDSKRNAVDGAGVCLEQLLRYHPDADRIVAEWEAERGDT